MPATDAEAALAIRQDARRAMEICNACRYCEGFCAVFPAMERRRAFADGDLDYLANLCHGCQGCYHACQYAPPHEFGLNLPRSLAELRQVTYGEYAWPRGLAAVFRRDGVVVSAVTAAGIALVLLLTMLLQRGDGLYAPHRGPGAFYAVIPWWAMALAAGVSFLFSLLALAMGAMRFWRATGGGPAAEAGPVGEALHDVFSLRNLGGGGGGCNDIDGSFSQLRRRLHHAMFYGFLLCFASTCTATVYADFLGHDAPYALTSLPVLLGTLGGLLMVGGIGGWIAVKVMADRGPSAPSLMGGDYALLFLLLLTALSGLLLLALRASAGMGVLLAVHLGIVLALFALMPYSKFVHGVYRSAALLRNALERRRMKILGEG